MPPKKKGGAKKKKKDDGAEPPHEPSWERIKIVNTASLRDAFCNELVKLSPVELSSLHLSGSSNLRNFVLSPATACPKLAELDLSRCNNLGYVLVQSASLRTLRLSKCPALTKVLVHCPHLVSLELTDNAQLETVMIWSDELTALDLSGNTNMMTLKLQCPALKEQQVPPLKVVEQHVKPVHPPIASMLKETYVELAKTRAEAKEKEWKGLSDDSCIPKTHRPF
ncbi:hypothetical protein QJQ45_010358 [Haematococcus lacustris]|nr:hypothetical protein QJQ45_010358 [Haematococcus lacustris]